MFISPSFTRMVQVDW